MKKINLFIFLIPFIFCSCENKTLKFSKPNPNQFLGRGEWLDSSDTINGISVRENKIAFFKKMEFNSEQIKKYSIIDSIYKEGKVETKIGEFLLVDNITDTLRYKIVKRN